FKSVPFSCRGYPQPKRQARQCSKLQIHQRRQNAQDTTPVHSPQSNGMAKSFVKTIKRDYVAHMPRPTRETALRNLAIAFEHYNEQQPRSALKYRSPREFRRLKMASS
ncbi:integrase core domain-containing protein, partial [Pseudomonas sp. QS1027]|uniref:integrase core domain-containing protein n=2 Tax=unclassified Pseudomonas TaxID=196821 RepID=UPI002114B51D